MDDLLLAAAHVDDSSSDLRPHDGARCAHNDEEKEEESHDLDFVILSRQDVLWQREKLVQSMAELLHIRRSGARRLLIEYDWNLARLKHAWFEDVGNVCVDVLASTPENIMLKENDDQQNDDDAFVETSASAESSACEVCGEIAAFALTECHHWFCGECWKGHIEACVMEGVGRALRLHCPSYKCRVPICPGLVSKLGFGDPAGKLSEFVLKNFVGVMSKGESALVRRIVWCPSPRCSFALASATEFGFDTRAQVWMRCQCGTPVCRVCFQEQHSPCPCDLARRWEASSQSSVQNARWIAAQTKPCTKCKVPIQKNRQCNHMTCSQCKHEFCWICLGDWKAHNGENWDCKFFLDQQKGDNESVRDIVRENANLQKYLAYLKFVSGAQDMASKVLVLGNQLAAQLIDASSLSSSSSPLMGKEKSGTKFSLHAPSPSSGQVEEKEKKEKEKLKSICTPLSLLFWEASELQWAQNQLLLPYRAVRNLLDAIRIVRWAYVVEFYAPAGRMRNHFAHGAAHVYGSVSQTMSTLESFIKTYQDIGARVILREQLVYRANALRNAAVRLEKDPLLDHLLNEPDEHTVRWVCVSCQAMHDYDTLENAKIAGSDRCSEEKCRACRKHGERDCRICLFDDAPHRPVRAAAAPPRRRHNAAAPPVIPVLPAEFAMDVVDGEEEEEHVE